MDLTQEQIDQIVSLELRRLDRDYNKTIQADGSADRNRIEGTPNLDLIMAENRVQKDESRDEEEKLQENDYEQSWETEEDGKEDDAGYQNLEEEPNQKENEERRPSSTVYEDNKPTDGMKEQVEVPILLTKPPKTQIDFKHIQETMKEINFPAPAWAKE